MDSRAASSLSSRARSKILPKVADFVANRSVGEFEFVQHEALQNSDFGAVGAARGARIDGGDDARVIIPHR